MNSLFSQRKLCKDVVNFKPMHLAFFFRNMRWINYSAFKAQHSGYFCPFADDLLQYVIEDDGNKQR
jgi:hypothetical protein